MYLGTHTNKTTFIFATVSRRKSCSTDPRTDRQRDSHFGVIKTFLFHVFIPISESRNDDGLFCVEEETNTAADVLSKIATGQFQDIVFQVELFVFLAR